MVNAPPVRPTPHHDASGNQCADDWNDEDWHHRAQNFMHRNFLQVMHHDAADNPGDQRTKEARAKAVTNPAPIAHGASAERSAME
ncbi:hypothetical protein DMI69_02625 [Escherichia coli]|nr:hypothetical protein [Escherichia coli]